MTREQPLQALRGRVIDYAEVDSDNSALHLYFMDGLHCKVNIVTDPLPLVLCAIGGFLLGLLF